MPWTASSLFPQFNQSVAPGAPPAPKKPASAPPVSMNNAGGVPSFLANPQSILAQGLGGVNPFSPYSELLSRILSPQGTQIPPDVAAAYSNAANAAAARTAAQTQAINQALALPGQAANLGMRANALAPVSLAGLPTGLGYRDPTQALRDQIFQTNAAMLPGSGINQLASSAARGGGWVPALPQF